MFPRASKLVDDMSGGVWDNVPSFSAIPAACRSLLDGLISEFSKLRIASLDTRETPSQRAVQYPILPSLEESVKDCLAFAKANLTKNQFLELKRRAPNFSEEAKECQEALSKHLEEGKSWPSRQRVNPRHSKINSKRQRETFFDAKDHYLAYQGYPHPSCARAAATLLSLISYRQTIKQNKDIRTSVFTSNVPDKMTSRRVENKRQNNICSNHFVVHCNSFYYKLDMQEDGQLISFESLYRALVAIYVQTRRDPIFEPANCTNSSRNCWSYNRKAIIASGCQGAFETIESALGMVHLNTNSDWNSRSKLFSACNREINYNDLTMNLRFDCFGRLMFVCIRDNIDEMSASRALEYILENEQTFRQPIDKNKNHNKGKQACFEKIQFKNPDVLYLEYPDSEDRCANLSELQCHWSLTQFCKKKSLDTDSVIQLIFQYAWGASFKSFGVKSSATIYPNASTQEKEQIHPFSLQSITFVDQMLDPCATDLDKIKSLKSAVKVLTHQKDKLKKNKVSFDTHFYALAHIAKQQKLPKPPFLRYYLRLKPDFRLATIQIPQKFGCGSYYPQKDPNCTRISYTTDKKDQMNFYITSYLNPEERQRFGEHLKKAFSEIKELLKAPLFEKVK